MEQDELNRQFRLILLFVFDKMEVALTSDTILQMCSIDNNWIPYMDCNSILLSLLDGGFICQSDLINGKVSYIITSDGRMCLSFFYTKIPFSTRDFIMEYISKNRLNYKKFQEYFSDYIKNADGTFTIILKIESSPTLLEIKLNTDSKENAEHIYKSWQKKASIVYESLYDILIE
jgi:hypothetical protein